MELTMCAGLLAILHHVHRKLTQRKLCIGRPLPGVTINLSERDHGEILIKSPFLFSQYVSPCRSSNAAGGLTRASYLGDDAATRAAFTSDGFYRSGDLAHLTGEDYILDGRASGDCKLEMFSMFGSGFAFYPYFYSIVEIRLTRLNQL
jgi:malonyl-CoA/methylmalonyl-CoA synthetase